MEDNNPLPEASKILRKFKEKNNDDFYYTAKDLKPFYDASHPKFEDDNAVYGCMKILSHWVRYEHLFDMDFNEDYIVPLEPINEMFALIKVIEENIKQLNDLKSKHEIVSNIRPVPRSITTTLECHEKTKSILQSILNLPEIVKIIENQVSEPDQSTTKVETIIKVSSSDKEQLKELVREDNLEKLFNYQNSIYSKLNTPDQIIYDSLSGQYKNITKDIKTGQLSNDDKTKRLNELRYQLLEFINNLETI